MQSGIFRFFLPIFAALLSGILLILAFPPYDLGWLSWVGLVPLLLAMHGRTPKYGFFLCFVFSFTFFTGVCRWVLEVGSYTLVHHLLVNLILGMPLALFGLAFGFVSRRWGGTLALLTAPFVWVSLEYARSNLSFLSLPWGLLAHSQYQVPSIIQISTVTGAYGVSFLILLVNSAFTAAILRLFSQLGRHKQPAYAVPSRWGTISLMLAAAALTGLALLHGHISLRKPIAGKKLKVSIVQGNIAQAKKWDPKYAEFIMQTYAKLTQEASKDRPALIIWPEAATPRAIDLDRRLYSQVRHLAENAGTYLLLGSSSYQKFKRKGPQKLKYTNSAFLISPDTKAEYQRYDKIHLVPFAEYVPLKGAIPWSYIQAPNVASYIPGREYTIFECLGSRFGVTICWESIFPELFRKFVKNGAEFMINVTNEGWFSNPAIFYQYVSMNVFRAVENRVYVVRCANTGVSCFIDPYGRIVDRVRDTTGRDLFVRGVLTRTVIPMESRTIYTRYGDWLPWLCIGGSIIFLIVALLRKNPD